MATRTTVRARTRVAAASTARAKGFWELSVPAGRPCRVAVQNSR
jgi:hypothetical protein